MNPDYVRDLPAHYLKHWGLLVDTSAYISVAPRHFALEVLLELAQYYTLFSYSQLHQRPSRSTGQRLYYWFLENCPSTSVSTSQT